MLSVALTTSTNCSGWPGIEPLEVPGLTVEDARQNDHRGIHWDAAVSAPPAIHSVSTR